MSTSDIWSRIFSLLAMMLGLAVGERLGAVAALEEEALAPCASAICALSRSTSHEVTSGGSARQPRDGRVDGAGGSS